MKKVNKIINRVMYVWLLWLDYFHKYLDAESNLKIERNLVIHKIKKKIYILLKFHYKSSMKSLKSSYHNWALSYNKIKVLLILSEILILFLSEWYYMWGWGNALAMYYLLLT